MRILPPRVTWFGLSLALVIGLTNCAPTRGGSIPYSTEAMRAPDPVTAVISPERYLVATGDVLSVTVFQAEKLSRDYTVDATGNIAIPLIGTVPAAGRTVPVLRDDIARRLGATYMNNPDVSVAVKESINRLVTVDGSVRQPGMFPVTGPMTLIQAVAMARGTGDGANPRRVAVFRTIEGKRMAAAFDLTSIRRGEQPDPQIYAGDIVVVDGRNGQSPLLTVLQTLPVIALFRPY